MLARGQQHVGGPDAVERATAVVGVHADPAGDEPADQRAAEVGRVDLEGHPRLRQPPMDGAQPRPRAHHRHAGGDVEVDVVEAREVEREPALVGHGPAHGGRGRAAQRHRHDLLAPPAQRARGLGEVDRLEDEVRDRLGQLAREQAAQVDVLVTVGLAAQEGVGDDALAPRGGRGAGLRARLGAQRLLQGLGQRLGVGRRVALGEGATLVQEEMQVGNDRLERRGALVGKELRELAQRLPDDSGEKGQGLIPEGARKGATAWRTHRTAACGARARGSRDRFRCPALRERAAL